MKRALFILLVFVVSISIGWAEEKLPQMAVDILKRHNELRSKHGAPPVKWNSKIAKVAQAWAETNAKADKMFHSKGSGYGENIFWSTGSAASGKRVVDAWYSEIQFYDYDKPGFSMKTGHFTQVIWKSSREIGAGWARSQNGGIYVVCNYSPPGNFKGRSPQNVEPVSETASETAGAGGEKADLSKSHSAAFGNSKKTQKPPVEVSAMTMPASNRKLLDDSLLATLRKLSSDNALKPAPLNLSITSRKVVLVAVEDESKLILQVVGADDKVPVSYNALSLSDRATLSLLVASLKASSKDAQAMAGVYMELLGKMKDASAFYEKGGSESSKKLAGLFD